MKKKIILLFMVLFFSCSLAFAEGGKNIEYGVIAFTFRNIAKAYISVADMAKLKKDNIQALKSIDERTFRRRYAKVFKMINELPPEYQAKYGINPNMNKEQAIKRINSWDKKKLCLMIDDVPQDMIGKYFEEYVKNHKETGSKDSLLQIKDFWERIARGAQRKPRQSVTTPAKFETP